MNKSNRKIFKLGLVFISLLVFSLSTGGALGVVWLKQQISQIAESCIGKEQELIVLHRKNIYLRSTIAQVHNPEYLKERIGAKVALPNKKQIVWMNTDIQKSRIRHLAAKAKDGRSLAMRMDEPRS